MNALRAVLCDPEGRCCIEGSPEDRAIVDRGLVAMDKLVRIADRISRAHDSGNNGLVMGEANLCAHFADALRDALKQWSEV